jgi:hypothetical protein
MRTLGVAAVSVLVSLLLANFACARGDTTASREQPAQTVATATPLDTERSYTLESLIADVTTTQAQQMGGSYYGRATEIARGDIDGDGDSDAAVIYTIEGMTHSNAHVQLLAVLTKDLGGWFLFAQESVGGKGWRGVSKPKIEGRYVTLETLEYADSDAACCPSINGKARFRVDGWAITEV